MNEIATLVSTIGFPIVACIGVAWFIREDSKAEREENAKRESRYLDTIDKFGDTLEKVNNTMISMDKRLEMIEKGGIVNE